MNREKINLQLKFSKVTKYADKPLNAAHEVKEDLTDNFAGSCRIHDDARNSWIPIQFAQQLLSEIS